MNKVIKAKILYRIIRLSEYLKEKFGDKIIKINFYKGTQTILDYTDVGMFENVADDLAFVERTNKTVCLSIFYTTFEIKYLELRYVKENGHFNFKYEVSDIVFEKNKNICLGVI